MSCLHVSLFGTMSIADGEHSPIHLKAGKTCELFCYLLLCRERPLLRENLASILWQETTTARSRANLRKTLWQLQTDLKTRLGQLATPLLVVESSRIQCNPDFDLWLDIDVFERAYERVLGVPDSQISPQAITELKNAIDLYEGDLLQEYYRDWCLCERERLRHLFLVMLDKVTGYCESHQQYELGCSYAERILACDPAREQAHQRIMRMRYLAGDRTGALRQFDHCLQVLRDGLGAAPAEETVRLAEQIQSDQLPRESSSHTTQVKPRAAEVCDLIHPLRQTLTALARLHADLEQRIDALEKELLG